MTIAIKVFNQIQQITSDLVETEICVDQNFPVMRGNNQSCSIEINKVDVSMALKRQPYRDLFDAMTEKRYYNIRFIDGAILLLQYQFELNKLKAHRLCFFPNPNLCDFQSNFDDYLEDDIYIDMIDPRKVASPLRFDYDARADVVQNITHPASHLTIGQYENCRIPVSRPLMPEQFVRFITRNFYNTDHIRYSDRIKRYLDFFKETITEDESKILHLNIKGR